METNQTIDGAGKIVGEHDDAKISITPGETLTNDTIIQGHLKITGEGTFVNSGTVHANAVGTLFIGCAGYDDLAGAEWKVTTKVNAVLHFQVPTAGVNAVMVGDWIIERGKLLVENVGFETSGSLVWTGGTIEVEAQDDLTVDFGIPDPV